MKDNTFLVSMDSFKEIIIKKLQYILPTFIVMFVVTILFADFFSSSNSEDFSSGEKKKIEMAEIKGIKKSRIIMLHAFPNSLSPVINVIAVNLAYLVVGVVIVEVVFVYPGLGQLLVDSVAKRDLPVVQASGLIFSIAYIFLNMAADILAMLSNPKLRQTKN